VIWKVTWEVQDIIKLKKFKSKLFQHCRKKERRRCGMKEKEDLENFIEFCLTESCDGVSIV